MKRILTMWKYPRMVSWLLATIILFLLVRLPFARAQFIPYYLEFQPGVVMVPLVGVFWGPAGAVGIFLASLAGDWLLGLGGMLAWYRALGLFLFSYSAKLLWDFSCIHIGKQRGLNPHWGQAIRFIYVSLPGCFLAAAWPAFAADLFRLYPFPYFSSLHLVNNLVFTILLGPALYMVLARELVPSFGCWREVMQGNPHPPLSWTGATLVVGGSLGAWVTGLLLGGWRYQMWPTQSFVLGNRTGPLLLTFVGVLLLAHLVGLFRVARQETLRSPGQETTGNRGLNTLLLLVAGTLALSWSTPATMAEPVVEDDPDQVVYWQRPPELPDAEELLHGVRSMLPTVPLDITAELHSKSRAGKLEKKLLTDIRLDWRPQASSANYTIRDAFGAHLESINVHYQAAEVSSYTYFKGEPREQSQMPHLQQAIQETDITWADLSLSFLWWPNGKTTGFEKIKGRYCYIVDIPTPEMGSEQFSGVRLWIDNKSSLLMQASAFDKMGEERRRLQVKNLQKVDGLWIVKDLEVRSLPSRHKTLLRVRTVEPSENDG